MAPAPGTSEVIEQAALEAFYDKGYHGASIREIASRAGIGLATVFHHYPSKAAVLNRIMHRAVDELDEELRDALDSIVDPVDRLTTAVRVLVTAHCERQMQSFVAQSEFRSLEPDEREVVRVKRAQIQSIVVEAIQNGVGLGRFECEQPKETAQAIVAMATMVATWYHSGGARSTDQVASTYADLAQRMLGRRTSPRRL